MYKRLSKLYNLFLFPQDWGICNADSNRVGEFIKIFLNHEAENPWEWEELADLVFESANEAILDERLSIEDEKAIIFLVSEFKNKFQKQLDYWTEIGNTDRDRFPVVKLIEIGKTISLG